MKSGHPLRGLRRPVGAENAADDFDSAFKCTFRNSCRSNTYIIQHRQKLERIPRATQDKFRILRNSRSVLPEEMGIFERALTQRFITVVHQVRVSDVCIVCAVRQPFSIAIRSPPTTGRDGARMGVQSPSARCALCRRRWSRTR